MVDELLKVKPDGCSICMCPSYNYENSEFMNEFLNTINSYWAKCFDFKVNIERIHFFIKTQKSNIENLDKINSWLCDIETKVRMDLSKDEKKIIINWEKTKIVGDDNLMKFARKLSINEQTMIDKKITSIEIMSLFALLFMSPHWYRPDWFIQVLLSFLEGNEDDGYLDNIQHRILGRRKITIIESEKNLSGAGWEAMSLCAKNFKLGKFPDRAYFKSVPNLDLDGPMRSKDYMKAIFLSIDNLSLDELNKKRGVEEILDLFSEINYSKLDLHSLIKEGANRLSQNV